MNKILIGFTVGTVILETTALIGGAIYAHRLKNEVETELQNTKTEVNKTIHKFAAVLAEFQV